MLTDDDKVELLGGEVVTKMTQNSAHRTATLLVSNALRSAFGMDVFVQEEKPVALSDQSEPEPDVAVVRGRIRDFLADHPGPDALLLVVEVADTSLRRDRTVKAALYAAAEVTEYWIVDLQGGSLEVYRDPVNGTYQSKTTHERGGVVSPLHAPASSIAIAELLP